MGQPQKSATLDELEHILQTYEPGQRTATNMIIGGPEDLVRDELAFLTRGADLFHVNIATVHSEAEEEALVIFDGNASDVAQLIASLNSQYGAASAR